MLGETNSTYGQTYTGNLTSVENPSQSSAIVHPTPISSSSPATEFVSDERCQDEPTAQASGNYSTYLSVMCHVSDLSSEDEEMNHAILASIETHL